MKTDHLRNVREALADMQVARQRVERTIELARLHGHSLREIAEAAQMSHEQVRRLVSR